MLLRDKVAIVTGASSGIGRAIARSFASEGATVALCSRDANALQASLADLSPSKLPHRVYTLDVSSAQQIGAVVQAIVADHGHIDVLASNAGVLTRNTILDLPEHEWDLVYRVNVKAAFLLTKAVGRHMVEQERGGSIIFVASVAGKRCSHDMAHYASSKAALIHFARCAATEFGPHGIRVNTVCPGPTDTPFLAYPRPIPEDFIKRHNIVLGKIATPQDVASAILFLASSAASHITGQVLNVDGGEAMM